MLSVIIPTLNAEPTLARALAPLVEPMVRGLVREVILADGGSTDLTPAIAEATGAHFLRAPRGRGAQLKAGAESARGPWLLFLHADTVLAAGWADEVESFMARVGDMAECAAAFRFALDDFAPAARRLEHLVALRCALLRLPYGDQGLLIPKRFYERLGGFSPLPLMEDVDLVRRVGTPPSCHAAQRGGQPCRALCERGLCHAAAAQSISPRALFPGRLTEVSRTTLWLNTRGESSPSSSKRRSWAAPRRGSRKAWAPSTPCASIARWCGRRCGVSRAIRAGRRCSR